MSAITREEFDRICQEVLDVDDYELAFVRLCREIGDVAECARWFSVGIADELASRGVPMEELSVGELLEVIRRHHAEARRRAP
jgi:hypothetical protein